MNPSHPMNTSSNSQDSGAAASSSAIDSQTSYVAVRKCTQCGYFTAIYPITICQACKERGAEGKANADLARYAERKTGKTCVRCGKQDAVEGKVLCQACADLQTNKNLQQREQRMARYDQLKAEGFCQECAEKTNREVAQRMAKRKAAEEAEEAN
ncbi:hypothetical protein FSARC_2921 [Fusarium sarcochroum]|uniref:Uncharacterized protein n=1 Tax=Fusarium sarcochroum TaxID=1208366 RepID=A0A8H4XD30_9HYPO|nr:hypothetical protein FSARC_2921 [Fusarium sarcochroum]